MTLWKALEIAAAALAAAAWFTAMFLWQYYDASRPRFPDPSAGRIYRLETHGSIAYLTRRENLFLYALILTAAVSFVAGACVEIFKKPFRRRS